MSDLPREWTWTDLGVVANVQWGNTSLTKASYIERGYSAFSAAGCDGMLSTFEHDGCGIVLSAIGARCGKCFLADGQWTAIKNTITITNARVDRDYLYYYLNNEDRWPNKGGAQPFITLAAARSVKVPISPLPEQRRIVAKIDSLTGRARRARDHLDHIPRLVEKYKQAILAAAFVKAQSFIECCTTLGEIAVEVRNGLGKKPTEGPQGTPILRISSVRPCQVRLGEVRYYQHEVPTAALLREGDLLFTRYNGNPNYTAVCGSVRGLKQDITYPDKLIRVRMTADVDPTFVELMCSSPQARQWLAPHIKSAAGQHGISGGDLKRLPLPMPTPSQQTEIVRQVNSAFAWVERLVADTNSARELIDRLDQSVLAKAFRGELLPQDPADEPAGALLERIREERAAAPKAKRGRRKAV